ncbi:unnamed protein product [marine sediment metagenome]|uniref:Uncharacterized protein n=1 Tax=marine sediment metagenome TaxID=412755 RepID=X1KFQ5_9ZZZZ
MPNKIIWTLQELEEEMKTPRISEFPPLYSVTALPQTTERIKEVSKVAGKVKYLIVYLPPGVRDLVWVSVSLLKHVPTTHLREGLEGLEIDALATAVGGDNQYHSLLLASDIKEGDEIEVIVKNFDTTWSHTAGVRVEVEKSS